MKSADSSSISRAFWGIRHYRVLLFFLLWHVGLPANAEEFRTNGLAFTLPETWKLNDKIPAEVNVQFDLRTTYGVVPIRFKGYPVGSTNGNVATLIESWKKFLENPEKVDWQTHSHTIGDREITYVEAWGALKYWSKSVKREIYVPNFTFFGAIIQNPQGNVSVYMLGRTVATDEFKPVFKQVIEDALEKKLKRGS